MGSPRSSSVADDVVDPPRGGNGNNDSVAGVADLAAATAAAAGKQHERREACARRGVCMGRGATGPESPPPGKIMIQLELGAEWPQKA